MEAVFSDESPTPRQLEILSLCANGHSREEIGRRLIISPRTVKLDLDGIREVVGARNVTHAVGVCLAQGLLCINGGLIAVTADREFHVAV